MPRFVPRQRKQKDRKKESHGHNALQQDSNQVQIVTASKAEKEEKRARLRQELRAQQPSVSSKKQKRLDKYIENKLKKDETLDYLRKLEDEKKRNDVKAAQTASNLGKRSFGDFINGVGPTSKADDEVEIARRRLANEEDSDSAESEDSFEAKHQDAFKGNDEDEAKSKLVKTSTVAVQQGSGLATPLVLGEDGLPVIQERARKKKRSEHNTKSADFVAEELPWEGFNSEEEETNQNSVNSEEESDSQNPPDGHSDESELDDADENSESEDSEDYSNSSTGSESSQECLKPRASAFKAWATQNLNRSLGHVPFYEAQKSEVPHQVTTAVTTIQAKNVVNNPILPTISALPSTAQKAYAVHVQRSESIQQSRLELPVVQREQEIMEAIHNHSIVVIKGDTGSGKTTQIPQLLYEAGYGSRDGPTSGMIGITQPRRVAAVSMAKRVAEELGSHGEKVAYQIRFDSNVSQKTAIKFMTDGILLRELSQDLLLRKYSVIVIDEAHERSVSTDILIGMLSKVVPARMRKNQFNPNPSQLKVIIMSATLNVGDFLNDKLFASDSKPPIVDVEGRQHRVTTHFALRSRGDYVEEVVEKVRRAHRKLPRGGVLVFLTGQNEIRHVGDRLRKVLNIRDSKNGFADSSKVNISASETPLETDDIEFGPLPEIERDDFEIDILTQSDEEVEGDEFEVSDEEDVPEIQNHLIQRTDSKDPYDSAYILPLYSQLPTKEQLRVFEEPPARSRLIVLATNVAETSLTIPGIRYVFDTGRSKERRYNLDTGVQSFEVDYISKASASQRTGRAGRTGPGHCWRLYTSALYEQYFPEHAQPEILRSPAESVVLALKSLEYPKPVVEFPFPTSPPEQSLRKAERLLRNLGALTAEGKITDLGKVLSLYPVSPRLGKIIANGIKTPDILSNIISLVAGLSVAEVFVNESQIDMTQQGRQELEVYTREDQEEDEGRERRRQDYGRAKATLSRQDKTSDAFKLLTAITMYSSAVDKERFCKDYFIRPKAMFEVVQLEQQLLGIVKANNPALPESKQASKVSSKQMRQINSIVASGYIDQVAIRADLSPNPPDVSTKPRRAIDVPYIPLIPLSTKSSADLTEKLIFIHPSSVLARLPHRDLPQYIVYSHLQKSQAHTITTSATSVSSTKTRMFPLTPIEGSQLVDLAKDTALLEFGKPLPKTKVEEIPGKPRRRECWVTIELRGGGAGSFGWPMPPLKVRQVMDVKSATGWRVEEVLK